MNNALYLRRRGKIFVPNTGRGELLPVNTIATVSKNLESLGYALSEQAAAACRTLSLDELTTLYRELVAALKRGKGAHRTFRPLYPNFPDQVMDMAEGELYLNALLHYWTGGQYRPDTQPLERLPLLDAVKLQPIDLGTEKEFEALFGQIAASNTSLSQQDTEDLRWFVKFYGDDIARLLPDGMSQKENMAFLAGLLLTHTQNAVDLVGQLCRTATDVLRLAVALSGGDVSLAQSVKFRRFSRPERRLLLGLLEGQGRPTEDMLRWKGRWVRLGERLHPGEFGARFPQTAEAFRVLRNDLPFDTFNSLVEKAVADGDVPGATGCLSARPGDLARRLDHLLRLDPAQQEMVIAAFAQASARVSTPVLLQVACHFANRGRRGKLRVFFPKGNVAKAHAEEDTLPSLSPDVCGRVQDVCRETLTARFRALPLLGRCYVDPALADYLVPFSQRSASKSLRTIVRGSKLPLPDAKVLRFFVWWRNGKGRTDIDLFDASFRLIDTIAYYNLKGYGGCHSGDIVNAPNGASEFIDITLAKVLEKGAAYVVMTLNSFTEQPYCDLPECFAGWMARSHPASGEIFEPKTVQDRLDITADTKIALPVLFDLVNRRVVWCDAALKSHPRWVNNVDANLGGIQLTLKSFLDLNKPNLYDLFLLHAQARGVLVDAPAEADTVFSVENETPFRLDIIASEYLK